MGVERLRFFCLCYIVWHTVGQAEKIDVMKIANVQFPKTPWIKGIAATINATYDKDIAGFTVCHRSLIESYKDGSTYVFSTAKDKEFNKWYIIEFFGIDNKGAEGYQGGSIYLLRNIPGGGLGKRASPSSHPFILARNMDISKERPFKY